MRHTLSGRAGRTWMMATALAAGIVLTGTPLFAQDLTLRGTMTMRGQETPTTQYLTAAATRSSMGDGQEVIIRLDAKKIFTIDSKRKTYTEMTFEDLQKKAAAAAASMENLPPEAAAQMKKMMGGMGGGGEVTLTPMGAGETIAGYATQKYHVTVGSAMEIDVWAAPDLPMPTVYYDAMKAIVPANPIVDMQKLFEEYKKIKGTQMKTTTTMKMMGQSMTTTMVVTSVEKGAIPAATFEVPAGFKAVAAK